MTAGENGGRLSCPHCGHRIRVPTTRGVEVAELTCAGCGGLVRARRRGARGGSAESLRPSMNAPCAPPLGALALTARVSVLRGLAVLYRIGLAVGSLTMLILGGFAPVLARWMHDDLGGWDGLVATLGGLPVRLTSTDPDADLGPTISRADAPRLFTELEQVARRLKARVPQQVRLTYLPCCGVTAWGRSQALILGLPLLHVLTLAELRAILAHELAHLAKGDLRGAAESLRFVETLGQAIDASRGPSRSPLRLWAHLCRRLGDRLAAPVARGQESRADRTAAMIAGGDVAAAALVQVALVQPLFREVLECYDPAKQPSKNLYAFFREFWSSLPEPLLTSMRHRLLSGHGGVPDGPHPALLDRLALVQAYPDRPSSGEDQRAAETVLGDVEALERMLHNRLFGVPAVEPSTFHRAGS